MTGRLPPESDEPTRDRGGLVVAVTADDDRYARARRSAMDLAVRNGARLLLYDWDAATVLGDPLPSAWSAEGTADDVPKELDETALEAAGRGAIAEQVREARAKGIDATAWLPSKVGADALADYARERGASTIVVPQDLHEKGGLEKLAEVASDPVEATRDASAARVVVVPDGRED